MAPTLVTADRDDAVVQDMSSMHHYSVRVLGPLRLAVDGQPVRLSPGRRSTLAKLIAAGPEGADPSSFLGDGRPDTTTERAKVRTAVSRLRDGGIPAGWVVLEGGRYRVDLPIEEVDIWHLGDLATRGGVPSPAVLAELLRPSNPFEDVGAVELIDRCADAARSNQRRLLERLRVEQPRLLSDFTGTLVELVRADPFDERLIELAALALADSGKTRDSLAILRAAHEAFLEIGLVVGGRLRELEARLLAGDTSGVASVSDRRVPAALITRIEGTRVGGEAPLERLLEVLAAPLESVGVAVVTGVAGVGKSRLLADAARAAHDGGWTVLYAAATRALRGVPYAPLLAALSRDGSLEAPTFAGDFDRHRLAHFGVLREAFESIGRRSLLLVDDAQWADAYTAAFLAHVASGAAGGIGSMWIAGRTDGDGADEAWKALAASFAAAGAVTVELQPLSSVEMHEFVEQRRPGMRKVVTDRVARQLHPASAGLPGIAGPLLASLSDRDLGLARLPSRIEDQPLARLVAGLPPECRRAAVVLAVIEQRCTIEDLVAVFRARGELVDIEELIDGVAELVDRELVTVPHDHTFEISHVLVQKAMQQLASPADVASIHLAVADVLSDQPDRAAWHRWHAVPLVPLTAAGDELIASARRLMENGAFAAAADRLDRVAGAAAGRMSLRDRGLHARALDLGGARERAREERHAAFAEAARLGAWGDALFIATSGLPETESFDGDTDLVDQLRSIPIDHLEDRDQWSCQLHIARQSVLVGDHRYALELSESAVRDRSSPGRVVELALVRRWASAAGPPPERVRALEDALDSVELVDPELRSEFFVNLAVDRFEAGDVGGADAAIAAIGSREVLTDRRRWFLAMLDATMAAEHGRPDAARLRQAAYEIGLAAGVGEADNSLLIAEFAECWIRDDQASLLPLVEAGTIGTEAVLLSSAAAASVCWSAGQTEKARSFLQPLLEHVDELPTAGGAASIALVSEFLPRLATRSDMERLASVLRQRGPSMILIGAGAACLGPTDRYLARLVNDADQREALLRAAHEFCAAAGLTRWEYICQMDRSALEQ